MDRKWQSYLINGLTAVAVLVALLLAYLLVQSLTEPVRVQRIRKVREQAVIERMVAIRDAQFLFRARYGRFTGSFDSLLDALRRDTIQIVKILGNPDDTAARVQYDTLYIALQDSFRRLHPDIAIDSLPYIPWGGGEQFQMAAGKVQRGRIEVPVFVVEAPETVFLRDIPAKYVRKEFVYRLGSLSEPVFSGNWE